MREMRDLRLIFVFAGTALLVIHSFLVLQVTRFLKPSGFAGAYRFLRSVFSCEKAGEKLEQEVQARIRAGQTEQLRQSATVLSLLYFYEVAAFLVDAIFINDVSYTSYHTYTQIACIMVGYGILLVLVLCPGTLTCRTLDLWYFLLVSPVTVFVSPLLCKDFKCDWSHFPRIAIAVLHVGRQDGMSCVMSGFFWCASASVQWVIHSPPEQVLRDSSLDILLTLSSCLLSFFMAKRTSKQVRATVKSEFLEQRQEAFCALLKNFYDVVLELDTELRIIGPAKELAVFLLYGTGVSFEGRPFPDIVKEDDRPTVVERLQQRRDGQCSIAEVVHAQMRGVDSNSLEAELFCFGFEGLGQGTYYIIGLREFGDEMHGVPKKGVKQVENRLEDEMDRESRADEEVTVTVDTSDVELPILRSSATFQVLVGFTPQGASLRKLVSNGLKFSGWVQTMMNKHLAGLPPGDPGLSSEENLQATYRVKFRPQGGVHTSAVCKLEIDGHSDSGDDDSESGPLVAKLVFRQVERKRSTRSVHSSSSFSSKTHSSSSSGSVPMSADFGFWGSSFGVIGKPSTRAAPNFDRPRTPAKAPFRCSL